MYNQFWFAAIVIDLQLGELDALLNGCFNTYLQCFANGAPRRIAPRVYFQVDGESGTMCVIQQHVNLCDDFIIIHVWHVLLF